MKRVARMQPNHVAMLALSPGDEIEFEEPVVERFQAVRKCTAGDAAAEMETLNHTFLAFKNIAQGGDVNVVYKRSDGGYGVIVPVDMD